MLVEHKDYEIYGNVNTLVFRLDFNTFDIAVEIVDWLEENVKEWGGDTRNYIGEYEEDWEGPGGYVWLIPFYVVFLNEDDFFQFKMVWE